MIFREATLQDIPEMQVVRNSVKENALSDPALISERDYMTFMFRRGKGWVCAIDGTVTGFSIVDLEGNNVWALFVLPECEKRGIGKELHRQMLNWYFSETKKTIWLSTAPGTRAELFYRKKGWTETGVYGKNEIRFEMSYTSFTRNS